MRNDTPVVTAHDGWRVLIEPGERVVYGNTFDDQSGYRVVFGFADSTKFNSFSVEGARLVIDALRQEPASHDAKIVADQIGAIADLCERLNAGWAAIGKPAGGFDALAQGRA